ncbi:MAG: hypothetical protein IH602_09110 [Bryobacteraceae bacterium]|nr:hypothetical protein [Bryobacteraceae bacterium]
MRNQATINMPMPDPHYRTTTYADWWGVSDSTIQDWFKDVDGVLRIGRRGAKRIEIRIPWSVAMKVYQDRTKA